MLNHLPGLKHFFRILAKNIFFHSRYPLVLMVVSESALGVLSKKHNFDGGRGGGGGFPGWNVKINNENQKELFLAWFSRIIFSLANEMTF